MNKLGFCYENDNGVEQDEKRTFEWYQKAAETGDGNSMFHLAVCYEYGIGTYKDEEKAFEWYQKGASVGNCYAMGNLGSCYEYGKGIEKNLKKAFEWYQRTVGNIDNHFYKAKCYYTIANMLRNNENIKNFQNIINDYYVNAMNEFKIAADSGNAKADSILGKMYREGLGNKEDFSKAFEHYERAAIRSKLGIDVFELGKCYQYGIGVEKNFKKAFSLYKKAAYELNYSIAYVYLGYCYQNGIGVNRNYKKGYKIFNNVINNKESNKESEAKELANFYIGLSYFWGKGVGRNYETAKLYLKKSVHGDFWYKICDGDYSECDITAFIYLDIKNAWNINLHIDIKKAYNLFEKAYLHHQQEESLFFLEALARSSRKLNISPKQAFEYATIIFEKYKIKESTVVLGQYYFYGYGTKKNYEKAFYLFESAYREGSEKGKIYLALCYSRGYGVEKNYDRARFILENRLTLKQNEAVFLKGLLVCGGGWGYKEDRLKGLQLMKSSIIDLRQEYIYKVVSAPQGNVFADFYFKFLIDLLYFDDFQKRKLWLDIKNEARQRVLWFKKNPNKINVSKNELYSMLQEKHSSQKQILKKLEEIDFYMKYLPDISERVNQIDDKINVILSNLETKIMHMKSECALENVKSDIEEKICHKFITEAMEIIRSSLNNVNTLSKEEDILQNMFGKYWELLDGYTRNSLVSARVLFSLSNKPEYYGLDYSGIVIAVTSALENELKLRFFDGYQEYLIKKYGNPTKEQWPKSMLKEKCGKIEKNDNFTIGSMPYIFGVYGEISQSERDILNDYLKKILNSNNKNYGIDAIVIGECGQKSIIARCEQVRRDYRNKAAHTKPIEKNLALKCCNTICDAIIAADEMEIIQGLLLDVVKLTSNYKNK